MTDMNTAAVTLATQSKNADGSLRLTFATPTGRVSISLGKRTVEKHSGETIALTFAKGAVFRNPEKWARGFVMVHETSDAGRIELERMIEASRTDPKHPLTEWAIVEVAVP